MPKKISNRQKVDSNYRNSLLEINLQGNIEFMNKFPWFFDNNLFQIELKKRLKVLNKKNEINLAEKLIYTEMFNEVLLFNAKISNQAFLISNQKNTALDKINIKKNNNSGEAKKLKKYHANFEDMFVFLLSAEKKGLLHKKFTNELIIEELQKKYPKDDWTKIYTDRMYTNCRKKYLK